MSEHLLSESAAQRLLMRIAARQPIAPDLKAELEAMPTMRKIALMQMTESHVKRAIINRLSEDVQYATGLEDYAALRARGWCVRRPADRWHNLTDEGRDAAAHLEKMLCLSFGIHLLREGAGANTQGEVRFTCPCGFSCLVRGSKSARNNATIRHARYIDTQNGMAGLVDAMKPRAMEG